MLPAVVAPVAIVLDTVCISQICIQHTVFPRAVVITDKIKEASDSCRPRRPRRSDSSGPLLPRWIVFGGGGLCLFLFLRALLQLSSNTLEADYMLQDSKHSSNVFICRRLISRLWTKWQRTQSVLVSRRLLGGNTA